MALVETGKLLVSRPSLNDPNFRRTVVLVFQHEATFGTMGVIVNRPSGRLLSEVVEKLDGVADRADVMWLGGPVQPSAVWVLHRRGDLNDSGTEIVPGLHLGRSPELLSALLKSTESNPAPDVFRVVRGYAGWAPGQLAREVREGSWRVVEPDLDVLFGSEADPLWDDVLVRSQLPFRLPPSALRDARFN